MYQLKEALTDPLTWAFVFYALVADIPNGGLSNFFSQLIVSFGYTPEQSLLYGTPGGAVEVVALIFSGWLGDRLRRRLLVSMGGMTLALLGMILIVALPLHNNSGRLAGYYLTQASPTPFVALLSLISTNVAGYTKKSTVAAMYLIAYCKSSPAPTYGHVSLSLPLCCPISSLSYRSLSCSTKFTNYPLHRHWQHHRSPNVPTKRCSTIRSRRNHYNRMLLSLSPRHSFHPFLVCPTEQD